MKNVITQGGVVMDTVSLWKAISDEPISYPNLTQNIEVDVAIVGAGITGITTALHLIKQGKKVAILEANRVGSGTTAYSTGNLYVPVQPYFQHIISKFNEETAKAVAQSRNFAIDYIENTVREKNIQCNFSRRPWYIYTNEENKVSFLDKEVAALKKVGLSINYTSHLPLPFKFKKAALLENQARFNPFQYVITLAADLHKQGCQIFENTRVTSIEEKNVCTLHTAQGKIRAKNVVIATHTPIGINPIQLFTAPYRSYVVAVKLKENVYPEGHFWDLSYPHHATCTHPIHAEHPELLMVAGDHHKAGQTKNAESHFAALKNFLKQHFSVAEIAYEWSAQHYQSADDIPYIGLARGAKHTYLATGYFADGLVYGTLAGLILGDAILQKQNNWSEIYRASRFTPFASAGFVAKENTNVYMQYMKDYPLKSAKIFDDIKIGEGKVVEIDREKFGVCRDNQNKLHAVSAVCTHMKCIVNWNNAEKTWDCPCHGSRFTSEGKVIEGPAVENLAKKIIKENN